MSGAMKIPQTLRNVYTELEPKYIKLKKAVDEELKNTLDSRWHYTSRVKSIQSFALKIETGRCNKIEKFEDFFACTVVVENLTRIEEAETLITERFTLNHKRPKEKGITHKRPEVFSFDDLRLYCRWNGLPGSKKTEINGLLFEVQIKTFLQHAWTIATHDLVYKTDEKNWGKERIAYQIKAMLEHAEVSIFEAEKLASSDLMMIQDNETCGIAEIINILKRHWADNSLPNDLKTLSINVFQTIKRLRISVKELEEILIKETEENIGTKAKNLSPFGIITQAIINQKPDKFLDNKKEIYIHEEVQIPNNEHFQKKKNIITIK
jgi:ppGpp synthetase/RelA/SpoT-type nucleotidyltranferase